MPQQFTKVDLTPKRWHGYTVFLFILGTLVPPLAVAARFGINGDFWLNVLLTICGYIPGHVHNFYIQNIRNNKNHQRTPKWVLKYGLIDTSSMERRSKRSQWAGRYNDRLPRSTLENQPFEEGQEPRPGDTSTENGDGARTNGETADLWKQDEEQYYGQNGDNGSIRTSGSGGRWKYPANFEGSSIDVNGSKKKKKKAKKDRWARTDDAYSMEDDGSTGRRRMRRKSNKTKATVNNFDTNSQRSNSVTEFPEAAEGGLFGNPPGAPTGPPPTTTNNDEIFHHQF